MRSMKYWFLSSLLISVFFHGNLRADTGGFHPSINEFLIDNSCPDGTRRVGRGLPALCTRLCEIGYERHHRTCAKKCAENEERYFKGTCVTKCDHDQFRMPGYGHCVRRVASRQCRDGEEFLDLVNGCVKTCAEGQEPFLGTCTFPCGEGEERYHGVCVRKCKSYEIRKHDACILKDPTNTEIPDTPTEENSEGDLEVEPAPPPRPPRKEFIEKRFVYAKSVCAVLPPLNLSCKAKLEDNARAICESKGYFYDERSGWGYREFNNQVGTCNNSGSRALFEVGCKMDGYCYRWVED